MNGRALCNGDRRDAIRAKIAYVPEDRLGTGLAPGLTITDNFLIRGFSKPSFLQGPLIRFGRVRAHTEELLGKFDVKGTPDTKVCQLSGGNAQRVLLAGELSYSPDRLVIAAPTRGLEVSAMQAVLQRLVGSAADGTAILLISEDLYELLDLSDRVAVMYDGRIEGVVDYQNMTREEIGQVMAGIAVTL